MRTRGNAPCCESEMVAALSSTATTPMAGLSVSSSPRRTACRPFRHVLPQPIWRRTPIATYSVRSMLVRRCGRNACSSIRAPIIAVLAQPDNQELGERADAYNRLIKDMAVLPVAAAPAQGRTGAGYVLTLDGEWKQGRATLSALRPSVISSPVCRVRPSCRRRAQPSACLDRQRRIDSSAATSALGLPASVAGARRIAARQRQR